VLSDLLETENSIVIAAVALLTYPNRIFEEPAIKGEFSFRFERGSDCVIR
jgi:hypothetical protein